MRKQFKEKKAELVSAFFFDVIIIKKLINLTQIGFLTLTFFAISYIIVMSNFMCNKLICTSFKEEVIWEK